MRLIVPIFVEAQIVVIYYSVDKLDPEVKVMFIPERVLFEKRSLDYPLGEILYRKCAELNIPVEILPASNRAGGLTAKTARESYVKAKRTVVARVRSKKPFQTCRPSADFQLPLVSSCPGMCEYCYLMTNLGPKPYIRVYVNTGEILQQAEEYIFAGKPMTVFEGAATSDPVPLEPYTGILRRVIEFFGRQDHARFRFVTKFTEIDTLLATDHRGHTRFRFSLNAESVISAYERNTPALEARLAAAVKAGKAGYPIGIIIGPIFFEPGWQEAYAEVIAAAQRHLSALQKPDITFELITHRFTRRGKDNILAIFPDTRLPLDVDKREFNFGQFGYGKYLYPKELRDRAEKYFTAAIQASFPGARIDYFI